MGLLLCGVTGSSGTIVFVVSLSLKTFSLDELEAIVHQTTVAALVAVLGSAAGEFLLRERDEFAILDLITSLNTASSREGPAGATLALVLHWSDRSFCGPVNRVSEVGLVEEISLGDDWLAEGIVSEHGALVLGQGHVSELVHAHGIAKLVSVVRVVIVDEVNIVFEHGEFACNLVLGIALGVVFLERLEEILIL